MRNCEQNINNSANGVSNMENMEHTNTAEDSRIKALNLTHIGSSAAEWLHLAPSVLHHGPRSKRDSMARECMQKRDNIHEVSSLVCTALLENKARSFHQIQMHSCTSHLPLRSIQMRLEQQLVLILRNKMRLCMLKITNNVPPIRHRKVQNEQTEISCY